MPASLELLPGPLASAVETLGVTAAGGRSTALPRPGYPSRYGLAAAAAEAAAVVPADAAALVDLDDVPDSDPALAGLTGERSPTAATAE
jgi:hypothetical protein